jgi:hypothetical protein
MQAPAGRPTGATVISVIEGILGVLFLLVGLFVGFIGGTLGSLAGAAGGNAAAGGVLAGVGIIFGVIVIAIGVLYLLIAYGVWKARGWAWMLGMVVSIIVLVFAVLGLGNGVSLSTIISTALPAIVVYFLWTPEVKRYLGRPA